jgi:PAS domain S-box-containing protein
MKAGQKIVLSLGGAVLLVGLAVVATLWAYEQITPAAEARQHSYAVINQANNLLFELRDAETGQRGYSLTGNEAFLQPYLEVRDTVAGHLTALRALTVDAASQQHLQALQPLIEERMAALARIVEARRNQDMTTVLALVEGGEGQRLMDSIRAEMKVFVQIQEEALVGREAQFQTSMRRLLGLLAASCVLTLLLTVLFAFVLYRENQHRLNALVHRETVHLLARETAANQQLHQASLASQVSEEKLAVTLHSIGDGVIATDAAGRVTLLNPVAEKLTGWTQAEALDRPADEIFRIIHQVSRLPAELPLKATLSNGMVQGMANHTVLIARDGTERAIADSCAPIRNRENLVVGAVLVFRDVSEEYAAEQAKRESAALIQTILNTVADGIVTLDANDGLIETVNPAAGRMFGYAPAELIGKKYSRLIPELERDAHSGSIEFYGPTDKARSAGLTREVTGQHRDGSHFPLEITVSEMWLNGRRYITSILRDVTTRKEAEESLGKAGALQSAIFNSANFSSIATDAKGVIQIFNVGAERMLGYAAADVMNKITPADISDPQEVIARAKALSVELATPILPGFEALVFKASRGIEDIYELTYIRKDGSRFPAVVSVTALRDAAGAIIGYLLIGTDNSARKRAEEALAKAGALQSAIFNSANFSSIATDAKGVIQIFNVGAERMLGYAAADVMNKITPADISDPQEVIERAKTLSAELSTPILPGFEALVFKASRGIEDIYELTYIRKDGSRFPAVVSVTALRDATGVIIGYLLIGTDNTARKQIEAEQQVLSQRLRDHQFYTRSLFEANIDALMTTDPAGIITDVNKQMEALTGSTRDELIGAPFKNYFTDPQQAQNSIKLVLTEKKVTDYELTARARDGKETVVSYNATTFYDRDRRLQGVFAAARDVTERKRSELALQETNGELESAKSAAEKANQAKSSFLSSMSHELRSPLNAILGFAQLMETSVPLPTATQTGRITQILQAGWHLLNLINEILDLAVIESGKVSLSLEPVSLAEVLAECQDMMEPQARQQGIVMSFPEFEHPRFVWADRTRLKQIIINLLSNAIKYNKAQGTVEVACTLVEPAHLRLSVRDTGGGLLPEQLAQLFQPFNRLGQETGAVTGTGIGLVVTKQLVELMDGVIGVDSVVGEGSVFWIKLLRTGAPELIGHASHPPMPVHARRIIHARQNTLLYIEDNPANMMLVEQLIERRSDLKLMTAVDAALGITMARAFRPQVILMDINLPGMSGIDALKILRADPATAHIPIVALSANAMPRDIELGLKVGFHRYLTKPIKVREFMDTMDEALDFAGKSNGTALVGEISP